MHKFFAKTLFLGKKVISLTQCHSTNQELIDLAKSGEAREGDIISTEYQSSGRGQRGASWHSDPGMNLLFSVLLKPTYLSAQEQYLLTFMSGLSVAEAVGQFVSGDVKIKWPNDVYVNGKKLAGILTEAALTGQHLEYAVVGMGINVNQVEFPMELNATSVMLESGLRMDRGELLESILQFMEKWLLLLRNGDHDRIVDAFEARMYWRGEKHTFKTENGLEEGLIQGVDRSGRILVEMSGVRKSYQLKELVYVS